MTERIWFTSDTHFGHKNILKFCPNSRPVKSVEEHDERLIRNWQEQVGQNDRVYHLGDFFFCNGDRAKKILDRLPGQIHFIHGNHDKVISSNHDIRSRFVSVSDYKSITYDYRRNALEIKDLGMPLGRNRKPIARRSPYPLGEPRVTPKLPVAGFIGRLGKSLAREP